MSGPEGLTFPTRFPVKAMGERADDFEALVVSLVKQHVPAFDDAVVDRRDSRNGRYLSVTVTFTAESRDQLDDVYRALTGHERIAYVI